jgi:pimeloyl-ACP methyl ester carboxylesterase
MRTSRTSLRLAVVGVCFGALTFGLPGTHHASASPAYTTITGTLTFTESGGDSNSYYSVCDLYSQVGGTYSYSATSSSTASVNVAIELSADGSQVIANQSSSSVSETYSEHRSCDDGSYSYTSDVSGTMSAPGSGQDTVRGDSNGVGTRVTVLVALAGQGTETAQFHESSDEAPNGKGCDPGTYQSTLDYPHSNLSWGWQPHNHIAVDADGNGDEDINEDATGWGWNMTTPCAADAFANKTVTVTGHLHVSGAPLPGVQIASPTADHKVDADSALHATDASGGVLATVTGDDFTSWCYRLNNSTPPAAADCANTFSDVSPHSVSVSYKDLDGLSDLGDLHQLVQGPNSVSVFAAKSDGSVVGDTKHFIWQNPPIVFIPGFGGTKIKCGDTTLFPQLTSGYFIDFKHMRLGSDGVSPYADGDACTQSATSADLLRSKVVDIYGDGEDWAKSLADPADGRNEYTFTYDWRKSLACPVDASSMSTCHSVGESLDHLIDRARADAGTAKVVIVAHSMGGLVTRAYIDEATRAAKVARAITIGTPYWGAPKSVFPITKGYELPDVFSKQIDPFAKNGDFQAFAATSSGLQSLIPSANYPGPWLGIRHGSDVNWIDSAQIPGYLSLNFGASQSVLSNMQVLHAQHLDGFKKNGVDYRAMTGSGLETPTKIILTPTVDGWGDPDIKYNDGDGTVPIASQRQQRVVGGGPVLGDQVPVYVECGLGHMSETEDAGLELRIADWLSWDGPVSADQGGSCPASGYEINVPPPSVNGSGHAPTRRSATAFETTSPSDGSLSLVDAANAGDIEVDDFAGYTIVTTHTSDPVKLQLPDGTTNFTLTPLNGNETGSPQTFTVGTSAEIDTNGTTPTVTDSNGTVSPDATPHTTAPTTVAIVHFNGTHATLEPRIDHGTAYLSVGGADPTVWNAPVTAPVKLLMKTSFGGKDDWGNAETIHYLRVVAVSRDRTRLKLTLACNVAEVAPCTGTVTVGTTTKSYSVQPGKVAKLTVRDKKGVPVNVSDDSVLVERVFG